MSRKGICDFCGIEWNPMDHTWQCHHTSPFEFVDEDGTVISYDEEWLVCQRCDILINTNNRKALSLRAAESHPAREPGNLREMFDTVHRMHQVFFDGWQDSHPLHTRRSCLVKLPKVQ